MDEKLTARIKLIYERDNTSPLFLRTADFYLQINDPQTAVSILEKGLKNYPHHPLAFILFGKAHYSIGNIELAETHFRKAAELLNNNRSFEYYKHKLNLPDKQASPFDSSRGNIFINSSDDYELDEEVTDDQTSSIENDLKQIAEKLMNANINRNIQSNIENIQQEYNPDRSVLATETFANIYISQGQETEAIKIYELLAERNPEKREYYIEKINNLKFK